MVLVECCGVYPRWLDGVLCKCLSSSPLWLDHFPELIFFLIDCGEMGIDISKSGYGFVHFCSQFDHFLLLSLEAPLLST